MGSRRIVIVEDERITAMDLEERLNRLGYDVPAIASAGDEAIRTIEETQPDLVLMDIVLDKNTDGVTAAKEVQARFGIPVVFLTAYSDDATWQRIKTTEPFGYLVKPVKDKDLRVSIEIALGRREAEKRGTDRIQLVGQFAEYSSIAMMMFDQWGILTFMNTIAAAALGLQSQDAIGNHVTEVFDLQGKHRAFSSMVRTLGTSLEADVAYDAGGAAQEGSEPEIRYNIVPVSDREGTVTGAILYFQPLTGFEVQRPGTSNSLDFTTANLHDAQPVPVEKENNGALQVMKALMQKSPVATIVLDPEGCGLACNSAFQELFLYGAQEVHGKPLRQLVLVKDTEPDSFEASRTVLSGHALHTTDIRRRKDNTLIVAEVYSVPLLLNGALKAIHVSYLDVSQRIWEVGQLHEQATTDALTGLANLGWFNRVLQREIQRSDRTGRTFAILMLDMDDLKRINDHYGHAIGNRSLCRLAEVLRTNCRVLDTAARYGGDEFVLILPETGEAAAWHVAHRIANQLSAGREQPPLTVSAGVAVFPEDGDTAEALLETADRALYETKRRRGHKFAN
jgi:diguanylate cyclase (GGDEF)-like protein/PAS domain S-box-containing protein